MQSNNQIHIQKKFTQTHLEGAVESGDFGNLVLNHFCFESKEGGWVWFGLIWGGDSGVFFSLYGCVNLHFSETSGFQRESQVGLTALGCWSCCGVLNGRPVGGTKHKTRAVTTRHNNAQRTGQIFFAARLSLSLTVKQEVPQREKPCLVVYHVARSLCSQLDCNKQLRHACTCPTTGLAAVGSNICV